MKNVLINPLKPIPSRLMLVGAIACGLVLAMGSPTPCLAQASKKGEKAADSLKKLAKEVQDGETQLAAVRSALDQLVNKENPDLAKPFKTFEKAVDKLTKIANDAKKRRDGLNENRDAYFKAWDEEIGKIQNEDIRKRSTERRQKVQQQLEVLSSLSTSASEGYRALEQNLKDIQTALGSDLTAGGVKAIAPVANSANQNAVKVGESLTKLRTELETLGVALSAKAAPKAK